MLDFIIKIVSLSRPMEQLINSRVQCMNRTNAYAETTNIWAVDVALHTNHHYKYISFDFILWIIVSNFVFRLFHLLLFVCSLVNMFDST